ncbi:polysaccharide deacetylase family protein [Colwellia sp. 12G3]|uniref:polysaccharide deacetylase family protein n=1 Tax=Colwellia sp. 12G3 TaxID=2058299 RepID=UPI000C338FDD|nr:polysaccharide deacetylase family protein [Colwellia sp. 12G3]PKI13882.1 polysaccharide deacetylase [Colwellia sp. 12G3]
MVKYLIVLPVILSLPSLANEKLLWPNNAKAAVNLAYDDALNSQLDHVLPALNKLNLKATFYLTLNSSTVADRLTDWRKAAQQGHELGNHSINHACRGSLPNRAWVPKHNDLDKKYFAEIIQEVHTANSFLKAIDGETVRTFTVPCTDQIVENKNYVAALHNTFVGIKSHVGKIPQNRRSINVMDAPVWTPSGNSGAELIAYAQKAALHGTIANFTFHGVGSDHLSVSKHAHQELLDYLVNNKAIYWVDTYRNISLYVKKNAN